MISLTGLLLPMLSAIAPARAPVADTVPRYDVTVTIAPERGSLSAVAMIRLPIAPVGTEHRFLLGRSYTVTKLSAEGGEVSIADTEKPVPGTRTITIRATAATAAVLRVEYAGKLFALAQPSINEISPKLVELSVDSFWLPYSVDLGAPFTVTAVIRGLADSSTVVGNVPFQRTRDGLRFESVEPTRDLAFVASPALRSLGDGRFRLLSENPSSPTAKYYREHGAASVDFLEKLLGPMPGGSATVAIVPRPNGSGYARAGYVVVTETAEPGSGQAKFIAHEFSHLWFTRASATTEDYWLVETPAEYLGLRYVESALGEQAFESIVAPKRALAAKAPPLLGNGRANDGALYAKGPLLLFDLEKTIGRPAVDRVLRQLATEPRHTTAIFLRTLGAIAGDSAARAFEAKLRS